MTDFPNPISLRISVTDRCQLRCSYCMPSEGIRKQPRNDILSYEEMFGFVRIVQQSFGISKVHITGGDPLIRPGICNFIALLHGLGISDLALTTNGQLLAKLAGELKSAGLKRINISLDTLNPDTYFQLTRGGALQETLDGIAAVVALGFTPIKLNTVVMRNVNANELVDIARFGLDRGCQSRFLELMPLGVVAGRRFEEEFVAEEEIKTCMADAFSLERLNHEQGGSSRNYHASDRHGREGIIGFISPYTEPFCGGCRRIRLMATGNLIGCLALGTGPNIRSLLRDNNPYLEEQLKLNVEQAMNLKRNQGPHSEWSRDFQNQTAMVAIGG